MGDEIKGTGNTKSTKPQQGSVTATFEGQMTPQTRETLIAGVKKLAKDSGLKVEIE